MKHTSGFKEQMDFLALVNYVCIFNHTKRLL